MRIKKIGNKINKCSDKIYAGLDVVSLEGMLKSVGVVVVTEITFYEVAEKLKISVDCPIVSLEDILYEV